MRSDFQPKAPLFAMNAAELPPADTSVASCFSASAMSTLAEMRQTTSWPDKYAKPSTGPQDDNYTPQVLPINLVEAWQWDWICEASRARAAS